MNLRLTTGQTSGEKIFGKTFYWLKRTAVKFQWLFGGRLSVLLPLLVEKPETRSCLLKDKKGRNC